MPSSPPYNKHTGLIVRRAGASNDYEVQVCSGNHGDYDPHVWEPFIRADIAEQRAATRAREEAATALEAANPKLNIDRQRGVGAYITDDAAKPVIDRSCAAFADKLYETLFGSVAADRVAAEEQRRLSAADFDFDTRT